MIKLSSCSKLALIIYLFLLISCEKKIAQHAAPGHTEPKALFIVMDGISADVLESVETPISIESLKKVVIPVPGLEESLEGIPNHQQSPQSVTITCLPVYGRINIMSTIMTLKPQTIITGIYSGYLKTITRRRR